MPDDPRLIAQPLSHADLEHEATISERDKVEDVKFWRDHGSTLTNALLEANPDAQSV